MGGEGQQPGRPLARGTHGAGAARPSFLLAEAARSACAPSMRAVKAHLAACKAIMNGVWGSLRCFTFHDNVKHHEEVAMAVQKLSSKNQIVIPKEARQAMGVKGGDELLVVVKDDLTLVMPKPKRYAQSLQGLAKGLYPSGYLKRERRSW